MVKIKKTQTMTKDASTVAAKSEFESIFRSFMTDQIRKAAKFEYD